LAPSRRRLETFGVSLLDARASSDDQLAAPASMTGGRFPIERELRRSRHPNLAREVARLDIGQEIVVRKGTALAIEAFEGTDDMLRRPAPSRPRMPCS